MFKSKIVTKNIDRNFKAKIFIMESEPSINGRKKIETLQKEFTQKFPYLTLVFLDKDRRPIDISKSLSEVRLSKGEDISIIASLKVNTLEKRFLANFGLVAEIAYQKSGKVVYTKDNVDKTLNELNKWCEENDCQPFEFKKSFTGNTLSSVQEQLFEAIKGYYPNAEAKKINKDNYLDIYIPEINKKRGTHLFFNTAKDGIKIGFYCRDEEFVENVISNSSNIEKYSQGIRILNNPLQNDVDGATNIALSFIEEIIGEQNEKKEKEINTDAILKEKGSEVDEQFELSAFEYLGLIQRYQEKEEEDVQDEEDYDEETEEDEDDDIEEDYDEETEEDEDKEDLARVSQTQIIKREKFNGVVLMNNYPVNSYDDIQKLKDIIVKDFKQIRFISKNLQENENAIKELIFLNNKIFPYLPIELKNKETIIKIAIEAGYYDESFIEYIDVNNKELLEKIISKAPLYFKLTPESSKSVELTRLAITKCDEIEFEDLPKSIQSNLGFFEDLLVTIRNNTSPFRDYDKIYVGMDYSESIHFGYVPLFCNNRDFILKYGLITNASDDISQNREFCFEYHNKWNNSFESIIYANPALADDIEFIRLGLSYDMANFRNLKDNYSNNKELLDFAVKNGKGRLSIRNIPESLLYIDEDQNKADINLLTNIVENNNYEITIVPEVIRHNPEYAKSLIWAGRTKTNILYYAPKFLRKDREFVKALFKINPISLVFADLSILSDHSFMCDIIKDLPIIIKFCSKTLQRDKNFILDALKNNGLVYKYITEALKADPEVYWAALKQNVDCFSYLPSSVQGIQSVLEHVSLKNGSLIDKCASKIKSKQIKFNAYLNSENNSFKSEFSISKSFNEGISDDELLSTLKVDSTQIIFLTEQFLSQDRQRLLEILKYSPYPLQFKSCRNILNQYELNKFIKENSWFFKYLDETEKSDSSFIKEMLSINGLLIQYLSNEQKQDLELVKIALKQSTNACRFLSLEIDWESLEAKSIAIELLTQDPSQISYFIHLDDLSIRSNVEDFFFHAFALDVSLINLINPTRVSTDYSTTPWFNSNVYGSYEMNQDKLVLGMNQDGKFFNFNPIFNISTNIDIAISHGRDFNWEGLFNQFDEIELIETAFKYFPNEDTYKALENKIGKKIESQEYINPITISETPNLYTLISKDAQGLLDNAIAFIRAESVLDYSEKFEQLPPVFKTNKIFLDSISDLEITFEILDAFFDKKILQNEHFVTTYLKKNYHEYINLPENLQTNRNIALSYGTNYVKTRFTYDTELKLNEKFKKDKSLLIEISSKNLYNNFTISGELLSDHKFLFEIIKFQPQLIQTILKDSLNSKLIIDVIKININAFDYLEPEEMLIPEVFDYVVQNDPSKFQKWKYSYTIIELVENLKSNPNIIKVINFIDSDTTIEIISDFHPITTKVFNGDGSSAVSDIGTLYHVNGYCEFTLGYDNNCYLSEDVAGVIDYEVINAFLDSDESWSDYVYGESWYDFDSIYNTYGIIEPATDLKLPNEEIVGVKLKYERPECDKFLDCFNSSELGDFVHIASSDEKSYSWEGWKRYKLEVAPGIFDVNKISVEFEGDIVSGYAYNYSDGTSDDFEEISDYSTSGKGFTGDLYFNNGKALISVDSDELKEALDSAGIEYDEHERLKEFCEKFYQDKTE